MKYRHRPTEVEAVQWFTNGDHPDDGAGEGRIVRFFRMPHIPGDQNCGYCPRRMHIHGWIETLEGGHVVCPGDWIVKGIANEFYPVKPSIFEATYEMAE